MLDNIKFTVYSGLYHDFFNYLIENGYFIKNIKSTDFGFSAECSASDYILFAKKAKSFQCKIKVTEKTGAAFKLKKLKKRKGIAIGIIISLILFNFFNSVIWKININIDDKTLKNNVANMLYDNNIYAGAIYDEERLREMQKLLVQYDENIGYAALNFYKGTLNCEIYPTTKRKGYLDGSANGDIVATTGGVIKDLRVYDGYSELKLEQSVSKGETLVSSLNPITLKYIPARAYIAALCNKEYTVTIPFYKHQKIYTGRTAKNKIITFFNFNYRINSKMFKNFNEYSESKTIIYYNVFGFYLPITVENIFCAELEERNLNIDLLTAQNLAKSQIERQIIGDTKIVEEYEREYLYYIDEEKIKTTCRVSCLYDIT